jgi:hypothetical protein
MEFVQVPVPPHLVTEVMALIAARTNAGARTAPTDELPQAAEASEQWTVDELKRLWDESAPAMRLVLAALAQRPGTPVSGDELADSLGKRRGHTIAGMMGALGRRLKHRHAEKAPFSSRWNALDGRWEYVMPSAVAEAFSQFVSIGRAPRERPAFEVVSAGLTRYFSFIRSPLGQCCRITDEKPTEAEASEAADRWLDSALLDYTAAAPRAFAWVRDPAGHKDMHVCVETKAPPHPAGPPILE